MPYGTHDLTAEYTGDANYESISDGISGYDVQKKTQDKLNITGVPQSIVYGDDSFTLGAAGGSGLVTYTLQSGDAVSVSGDTVTIEKAGTVVILAVKAADDVYNETSTTITMTVAKATPTIQNNPSVNGANVGQVLSEFSLSDLTASGVDRKPLAGSFAWENPQMVIQGSGKHVAIFTSADDNYNSISCEVQVNLDTTVPEIVSTRVTPSLNGARLEVSATAGTPLTYQWQVKGSWIDIPGATTAAFDYTGLFPNTEYTVRVIVTDANGNSTTSDSITFRTGKQAVSFIITNNTDSQTSKITSGTSPNTGDNSMLFLYLTLFVVGIAGITWRVVWNKKHKVFSEKKKD